MDKASGVKDYIDLKEVNDSLVEHNARLLENLEAVQNRLNEFMLYDVCEEELAELTFTMNPLRDTANVFDYKFIGARVVNGTTHKANNYITINKGLKQGIKKEMGVVGRNGIVGVVKDVSENFSTIISILHKGLQISAKLENTDTKGSLRWDGINPQYAILDYIPKHSSIANGDRIVTSGYSAFFPANIKIGRVENFDLAKRQ